MDQYSDYAVFDPGEKAEVLAFQNQSAPDVPDLVAWFVQEGGGWFCIYSDGGKYVAGLTGGQ